MFLVIPANVFLYLLFVYFGFNGCYFKLCRYVFNSLGFYYHENLLNVLRVETVYYKQYYIPQLYRQLQEVSYSDDRGRYYLNRDRRFIFLVGIFIYNHKKLCMYIKMINYINIIYYVWMYSIEFNKNAL